MHKLAIAAGGALALVVTAALSLGVAPVTAQSGDASMTALTTQVETTLARRLVMNSIGANNDALHDMLDGVTPWDDFEFQARLLSMYSLFQAFPNLFRAEPNPWTEEGEAEHPATSSLATEAVWSDWAGFIKLNEEAAKVTLDAAFTSRESVLELVEELEAVCESCHEGYRKTFDFHDFEGLPMRKDFVAPAN